MNASRSHTSAQSGTSARIRSTACVVLSPDLVKSRNALCRLSMDSLLNPRRSNPDLVLAKHLRFSRTHGHRIRQHVFGHHAIAADESVLPDPAKLMHAAERLNHRPILHDDVPCERHRVSELRVIADPHIVRHMRVSHQQIVVADFE